MVWVSRWQFYHFCKILRCRFFLNYLSVSLSYSSWLHSIAKRSLSALLQLLQVHRVFRWRSSGQMLSSRKVLQPWERTMWIERERALREQGRYVFHLTWKEFDVIYCSVLLLLLKGKGIFCSYINILIHPHIYLFIRYFVHSSNLSTISRMAACVVRDFMT